MTCKILRKSGVVLLRCVWCLGDEWEQVLRMGLELAHVVVLVLEDVAGFSGSILNGRRTLVAVSRDAPFNVSWGPLREHLDAVEAERGGDRWEQTPDGLASSSSKPSTLGADEVLATVQAALIGDPETRLKLLNYYEASLAASDLDGASQVLKIAEQDPGMVPLLLASPSPDALG